MKLSDQLKQDNDCGDYGRGLEGYPEKAKYLEDLLLLCVKDLYSQSGKFKRSTGRELMRYVSDPNNGINTHGL